MIKHSLDFKRGELVATARNVLALSNHNGSKVLESVYNDSAYELERLIGNMFQIRKDLGNINQLCLLILAMDGEEHPMAPVSHF